MTTRNLTPQERDRIFGPLEVLEVTGRDTAVLRELPPLVEVPWGRATVKVHERAADSLRRVADDLRAAELLEGATPIVGFQPRLVRTVGGGNLPTLSAHAYGAAVDVRFDRLPQGEPPDEHQSVIAPHFERHGWFWGANFETPDAHHFAFQGTDPTAPDAEIPRSVPDPERPTVSPEPREETGSPWLILGALGLAFWVLRSMR